MLHPPTPGDQSTGSLKEVKVDASHETYLTYFMSSWCGRASTEPDSDDDPDPETEAAASSSSTSSPPPSASNGTAAEAITSLVPVTQEVDAVLLREEALLVRQEEEVTKARDHFQQTRAFVEARFRPDDRIVSLYVRGHVRSVSTRVLCQFPGSFFAPLFGGSGEWRVQPSDLDADGNYVMDVNVTLLDKVGQVVHAQRG